MPLVRAESPRKVIKRTHYRSREIIEATGMTERQLRWLDEQGIVRPGRGGGQGNAYRYSVREAVEISVIRELRLKGLSLRAASRIQKQLRQAIEKAADGVDPVFLIATAKVAHIAESQKDAISTGVKYSNSFVLVDIVSHFRLFV